MKKIDIKNLTTQSDSTIRQAMQAINKGEHGIVMVVNSKNEFVKVLTDGDIRRSLLDGHGLESKIDVIDSKNSIFVSQDTPMDEISILFNEKIRVIPVLNDRKQIIDVYLYDKRAHIAVAKPLLDEDEIELVNECIVTGWVSSGGKFVSRFEEMMANYCETDYAVACSSGTSALHLALLSIGIGPGDEVIVPSLTFIATANAVTYTGAKPVFVDSEYQTWNINPDILEEVVTERTKAIIPVHLYGHPANMDPINEFAKEHNLFVVEDVAEAHGATYKNKMTGSLGDAAIFSFFGNKIITTGEGGMVVTNDEGIADRCRTFRDHGMSTERRYWHEVLGYNYRMTNIQAALGVAQMGKIDRIIKRKKEIAEQYKERLNNVPGITLPANMQWASNVYWLYTILLDENIVGCKVVSLMSKLKDNGIDTRPIFPPVHSQPIYANGQVFPVAEKISSMGISLPSAPEIRDEDVKKICDLILTSV
jgi:perosamine synthetase